MNRSFKHIITAAALSATLLLSACGASEPSQDTPVETRKITVGLLPVADIAPLHLGIEQGFFGDEGLEVEAQYVAGGAAAVPGVVSGSMDVAFGNLMSVMVAADRGLPVKVIANGATTTGDPDKDIAALVVTDNSPLEGLSDLSGKSISVNTLKNIGEPTIRSIVDAAGVDSSTLNFVEVAFPDAAAMVQSGQVDAAWLAEPFLTAGIEQGLRPISYHFADFDAQLDISGYFATTTGDQQVQEKFARAMAKSQDFAESNPDDVRRIIGTYTKIEASTLDKMVLPKYPSSFNHDAAQKLADAAVKYGVLQSPIDVGTIYP